jgi:outer membrane protein assembly factor BamD
LGLIVRYMSVGIISVFLFAGCALIDRFLGEKEEKNSAELMSEGVAKLDKGDYEGSTEAFQKVKDRYPYSKYAITAELKMADSLYKQEEFEQAFDAYREFERLHPKNKDIPYVIYQEGMCFFRRITTIDRDQSHTLKAKEEFERLVRRFPRDDYANRARKNIRKCLIYLAEYELYVGYYYFKMGKYRTAMDRYENVIKNYPDMGQYHVALEYIRRCKEELSEELPPKKEKKTKISRKLRELIPFLKKD